MCVNVEAGVSALGSKLSFAIVPLIKRLKIPPRIGGGFYWLSTFQLTLLNCNVPADFGLLKERPKLFVQTKEAEQQRWLEAHSGVVAVLASVESAEALSLEECREKKGATAVISESTTLLMEMTDLMLDKEIKRLQDKKVRMDLAS